MAGYWERALKQRIGRRRALAATGAAAAGAALLAACGGGGEGGGGAPVSGLLYKPVDTTKSAVRGGTWRGFRSSDPANFDLHNFNASLQPFSNTVGSQLLKVKPVRTEKMGHEVEVSLAVEGDLAESWEWSPDKLTLTLKLNPRAKWAPLSSSFHAGAPASIGGRVVDADDVIFSWNRFKSTATAFGRLEMANEVSKAAPVESVTKVDNSTIQMKLVRPASPLQFSLATWNVGYFYILPKEGQNQPADFFLKYQFGAGPFYIDRYEPSVGMTLKRNPYFEERDPEFKRPFVDTVDLPLLADPATQQSQFRTGNLFNVFFASVDDTLKAKNDIPELNLITAYVNQPEVLEFGAAADSPWRDQRVRQAISMVWNRPVHIQAVMATDKLEAAGIPANVRWAAGLSCNEQGFPNGTYRGYWLDPQDTKTFGENAKYFQYNVAEAKALLTAAGYPNGITDDHLYSFGFPTTSYAMDILNGTAVEAGFKLTRKQITAADMTSLTNNVPPGETQARSWGNWKGIRTGIDSGGPDPASYIHQMYHKDGGRFLGYNPNGTASVNGDPTINEIVEKMFGEFDEKKRIDLAHEFQRYHAKMAYRFRYPGGATTVAVWWPAVANLGVWFGESFKRQWTNEWLDTTKKPLSKT